VTTHPASQLTPNEFSWGDLFLPLCILAGYAILNYSYLSPPDPGLWVQQARDLLAARRFEEALIYSDKLLAHFPTSQVYLSQAALIYKNLGRAHDEAATLERFIKVAPDPSEACPEIVHTYRQAQETDHMLDAANRCLALEPRNSDFQLETALAYERTAQFGRALTMYSKGVEDFPSYADFAIGRARVLLHTGRTAEAWNEIRIILAQNPKNADAELVAALAAMQLKRPTEAKAILDRAVSEHPQYQDLRDALKRLQNQAGPQ
jgi:tetratricopeptide (TPR) repeat protein